MYDNFKDLLSPTGQFGKNFGEKIKCSLISPQVARSWSCGEITKPETINYRTNKPEKDGLFCAKIFGPVKDWECLCGKYKKLRNRGITCDKCGVEVTKSSVRRERMGHIQLSTPVTHIWFLKSLPSRLGIALDMQIKDLEKVIYYGSHIVIDPGLADCSKGDLLSETDYQNLLESEGGMTAKVDIGASALEELLKEIDLKEEIETIRKDMEETKSETKLKKLSRKLMLFEGFKKADLRPEWMVIKTLPVLPADLRPLVSIDGGRFVSSDLNDLYRRVINRNNRLKRLLELRAPDIIIRNEKRMLQEAVDSLFDNGRRGRSVMGTNRRQLKSLADNVKGKRGRFRQNLLGKRVDYSGRSVIVVGPTLKLHECGLPKKMALELFRPFVYRRLMLLEHASSVKIARRLVERGTNEVWDALEHVIHEHPVLLNRAPTLHRLGIQAFEPVLIDGLAIQLHPLVCSAFNADFDGDQMAVHVPLTIEAQLEARVLMMASNNILSPSNGKPVILPTQDIVLGLYYMTRIRPGVVGEGGVFSNMDEVRRANMSGNLHLQAAIQCRVDDIDENGEKRTRLVSTNAGRVLLWEVIPKELGFDIVNKILTSKDISMLIEMCNRKCGLKETVVLADKLMYIGFSQATKSGSSIGIDDFQAPPDKGEIISKAEEDVVQVENQVKAGLLSSSERSNKVRDIWDKVTDKVSQSLMNTIGESTLKDASGKQVKVASFNPIYMYMHSGARGSETQIRQLAGMRGLMAKPDGTIIETPITASFREGLTPHQYFCSTHGARKGLVDTALKTANSGYLTRRLVDVSQSIVINVHDCETEQGIQVQAVIEGGTLVTSLEERVFGRVLAKDLVNSKNEIIAKRNQVIDEDLVSRFESEEIYELSIRSPVTCECKDSGICVMCYGRDLARGNLVSIGEAVGVVAAQSIGEPGTQLTMDTFHIGGAASRVVQYDSVTANNKGKIELENLRTIERADGMLVMVSRSSGYIRICGQRDQVLERYRVPYGSVIEVKEGDQVSPGAQLASWNPISLPVVSEVSGIVKFNYLEEGITTRKVIDDMGIEIHSILDFADRAMVSSELNPSISVVDEKTGEVKMHKNGSIASYQLPPQSRVELMEGSKISAGDVIARVPREEDKTRDITGGLPRVSELFEVRKPKDAAVLAEITGTIKFGKDLRNKTKIIIEPLDEAEEEVTVLVAKNRSISVVDGQQIERGEYIVDGTLSMQDILRLQGINQLVNYFVNEIQDIYRTQGVKIDDKHIEIVLRQLIKRAIVEDAGDTSLVRGSEVDISEIKTANEQLEEGQKKAVYKRQMLGIARAALANPSFISAASFQETTRVLTEAAVTGKVDYLKGLKENVIMGRMIPAGTGFLAHQKSALSVSDFMSKEEAVSRLQEQIVGDS